MLSAADPLNLTGIVLPGPRIPALLTNTVSYTDGVPAEPAGRVLQLAAARRGSFQPGRT